MTSSTDGDEGHSFGWINRRLIESCITKQNFNPVGGEERLWLGPEGGRFSYYFASPDCQTFENWQVPSVLDTEPFEVAAQTTSSVHFTKRASLLNAVGNQFDIAIDRRVELLNRIDILSAFGLATDTAFDFVAYRSDNTITNCGTELWDNVYGMPSVWMLGMFTPSPQTTVVIPYNSDAERIVTSDYFGTLPEGRLKTAEGALFFKIDGRLRSKIGLPKESARNICGSYDSASHTLTMLKIDRPSSGDYVNGKWGTQADAYAGDVLNAYNDGPTDTGEVMGPFFEIEASSPAASLRPSESLTHTQYTLHLQGSERALAPVARQLLGISLEQIKTAF